MSPDRAMLIRTGYALWRASMVVPSPFGMGLFDRMRHPRVGDTVMETSSIHMRRLDDVRIGKLVSITREPLAGFDLEPGEASPTEEVWRIDVDGKEQRWTNASFVALPGSIDIEEWCRPDPEGGG